jgi:hypothetical protein
MSSRLAMRRGDVGGELGSTARELIGRDNDDGGVTQQQEVDPAAGACNRGRLEVKWARGGGAT